MQTIVFCNSENEALEPVTLETPLEMLSICGKRLIDYVLENLAENGITSCTVVTESIDTKEYIDRLIACDVKADVYLCNEEMSTRDILKSLWNEQEDLMVIQADGVMSFNLSEMIKFCKSKGGHACVYALKTNSRDLCGESAVEFDKQQRIEYFYKTSDNEFSSTNYKTAPVYIIFGNMMSEILEQEDSKSNKKGLFSWVNFKKGQNIYAYIDENCEAGSRKPFYQKIETTEDLLETAEKVISSRIFKIGSAIEDGVYSNTPYLFRGVSFIPPVYIGKNVKIGMGSIVGKGTVVEDNASIGECVDITGSYIGEYSKIGNRVKADSAVICKNARVSSGAELDKLSVAGEGSAVEENSVICEGVKLWNGKTLTKNTRLKTNLRYGSKPEFSFNEEGSDKLVSTVQAAAIGCAVGSALDTDSSVLVCCEVESCSAYVKAIVSGLMSAGVSVWDLGVSSERIADFSALTLKADVYAVISANPSPKLVLRCPGGLRIKRDMESETEQRLKTRVFRQLDISDFGRCVFCGGLNEMYISAIMSRLPDRLRGINVTVKTTNEKTAQEVDRLIAPINDINGEEIVFHFLDNTGKVTAYSEKTGYVIYEKLVMLCAKIHFEKQENIAIPFTFPCAFDDLANDYSANVYRYYTTSCSSADDEARRLASRECNCFVHDGMFLIADILNYLTEKNISLSDAVSELPEFYTSERFLAVGGDEGAGSFLKEIKTKFKRSDEGIVINKNNARAVIKPVKKGRGLMLYVDSERAEIASALCEEIENLVRRQG